MIDEICVRNLALIKEATLRPGSGMTAITGETGTGKTALLASCRLLMGQRADKDLVREGEDEASVEGRLFLDASLGVDGDIWVDEQPEAEELQVGLAENCRMVEREMVVSRRLSSDGRSRVKINGQLASVSELASLVSPAIDLCSQHDHQLLLKPQAQRHFLDMFCGNGDNGLLDSYREAYANVQEASRALDAVLAGKSATSAALEEARRILRQIDAVEPSQEDYDELMANLRKSENAELLSRVSSEAYAALSGEGCALDNLNGALGLIEDGAKADSLLSAQADSLRDALFTVEDVARDIAAYSSAIDLDVGSLEFMQERAAAYQSLMRSFGPEISDVVKRADEARSVINAVENSDEAENKARAALEAAESALHDAAQALSKARLESAPTFSREVSAVMSRLEMGSAEFICEVEMSQRDHWTIDGPDEVRFMYRPSAGMQCRPMARIASGGELSRVMLALHVIMGSQDSVPTLVFDEIDAGVGGSTALALGEVLAELAQTHQVIVVTHLAQVAARASHQYVVSKSDDEGIAQTCIQEVSGEDRIREIARMLSGSMTDASLQHARELLGH